jgi:hypothetical protein
MSLFHQRPVLLFYLLTFYLPCSHHAGMTQAAMDYAFSKEEQIAKLKKLFINAPTFHL